MRTFLPGRITRSSREIAAGAQSGGAGSRSTGFPQHPPPAPAVQGIVMGVVAESLVLVAAGALAGLVGAAGGITSLVSYPALLAVGVAPLPATVANLVACVACWPGSALTSRRELVGSRSLLVGGLPVAASGAAAGAVLLLSTPPGVFDRLVPFLVAAGSVALLAQPRLTPHVARRQNRVTAALPLVGLVSVYAGYFGSGAGVLLLAMLLVLVDDRLPEANAAKNMLLGVTAVASAAVFVVAGPVEWGMVAPLAVGLFAGSAVGPVLARRVPAVVVRWSVAALGLALAVQLWVAPG